MCRLHRTTRGEWQLLLAAWARDQIVAANQNRVELNEFGWWVFERREVFSGPLAVVSRVPLELNELEMHKGLIEGARSMLEPQFQDLMKAIRVQRLKRRETSAEGPTKSSWVPGKSVRVIFPGDELRQKFLSLGGVYLFWQLGPIRDYVTPRFIVLFARREVVIPPNFIVDPPIRATEHENRSIKYEALPIGGGTYLAISSKFQDCSFASPGSS